MNADAIKARINECEGSTIQDGNAAPKSNMGTNQKTEKCAIKIAPIPFDSTIDAMMMTTLDIAANINAMFRGVYKDYDGCTLYNEPQTGRWKATIYFRENANVGNESTIKNIESLSTKVKNGDKALESRLGAVSLLCSNVHYKLTQQTTESLSKYYLPYEKSQKTGEPDWKRLMGETQEQGSYGYNSSAIYVSVIGLDVISILKDIYGWKNDENHDVDYWLIAVRPVTQFIQSTPNMLFTLQRVDCKAVETMSTKIGAMPAMGRLQIIR